jgi:hypothetical protein
MQAGLDQHSHKRKRLKKPSKRSRDSLQGLPFRRGPALLVARNSHHSEKWQQKSRINQRKTSTNREQMTAGTVLVTKHFPALFYHGVREDVLSK